MRLLHSRVTALAFSSDGAHLAAAAGASLAVLFADSLIDAAAAVLDAPGDVTCLAFSPDDELLAGGNAHGDVHLLRPNQAQSGATLLVPRPHTPTWPSPCLIRYATLRILRAASSPILSLDWSADCELITAASARCELSHWEARRGRKLMPNHDADAAEIAAASWASITSPLAWEAQVRLAALSRTARQGTVHRPFTPRALGWLRCRADRGSGSATPACALLLPSLIPSSGVLPKLSDGSDVSSAHRSPDGTLLATSDDFRKVSGRTRPLHSPHPRFLAGLLGCGAAPPCPMPIVGTVAFLVRMATWRLVTDYQYAPLPQVNLFRCPCGPGAAAPRAAAAHAAHVPLVRFTCDGRHLISVGGPDLTAAVWRVA
eukprot:scaffold9196_cov110-Isochrysis_galbana.AAC.2